MKQPLAFSGLLLALFFLMPQLADAAAPITYRYSHYLFTIDLKEQAKWSAGHEEWFYNNLPVAAPQELLVEGDTTPSVPAGFSKKIVNQLSSEAIEQSIQRIIANDLNRTARSVTIARSSTGITFSGVGLPGREVMLHETMLMTKEALKQGITEIDLPMRITEPQITVLDPTLRAKGIRELVTVGESDFSRSPANRRHNIRTGMSKFQGHIIPQGTTFSFGQTIGKVDGSTGYLKELVIKGDRTEPDYGGGLCQVSTTAYRGVWEYGLPILDRRNHSYTVSHYFPSGTDATVYPPNVDMKFKNDTPGDLLMQTYIDGDNAYFVYYGTKDTRKSTIVGPYIWDRTSPPPDKQEFTLDLPPGEKKKLGERVPGLKAAWFRVVKKDGNENIFATYSSYQARPLFHLVGVAELPSAGSGTLTPGISTGDFEE